jgi:hypothetical protein
MCYTLARFTTAVEDVTSSGGTIFQPEVTILQNRVLNRADFTSIRSNKLYQLVEDEIWEEESGKKN